MISLANNGCYITKANLENQDLKINSNTSIETIIRNNEKNNS